MEDRRWSGFCPGMNAEWARAQNRPVALAGCISLNLINVISCSTGP